MRIVPPKPHVIRDMKRGHVLIGYKGVKRENLEHRFTLIKSLIDDKHVLEVGMDNPLDTQSLYCYNLDEKRWVTLDLTKLDSYEIPGLKEAASGRERPNSVSEAKIKDAQGTRDRVSERVQTSQKAQTDDRGTKSSSDRETR